jgi:predicted nucleic acid-binding Zn ribbon protein
MHIITQKQKEHLRKISKLGIPLAIKACNKIREENIKKYNLFPKLCKTCNMPIEYDHRWNNFCSKSCSATNLNAKRIRDGIIYYGKKRKRCTVCNKPISPKDTTLTMCRACGKTERLLKRIAEIEKIMISSKKYKLTGYQIKSYLIYKRGHKCEKCHNTTWNNDPIPLNGHHIDGNYLHNHPDNLKLICPNCHAQTSNYCSKNKPTIKRPLYKRHRNKSI